MSAEPGPIRPATPPVAHLDDLLRFEEAEPVEPSGWERRRPWLILSLLQTFAASAVLYTGFRVVNLAPPYALLVAVCAGAVLVRQAVVATAEPKWRRTRDTVRSEPATAGASAASDGMLDAVGRWDRRLDWGTTSVQRFDTTVVRRLAEIADERLRQRHHLTRLGDPVRARELFGEDLWLLIHGSLDRVPPPARVAAALQRLEQL
jgi:hypothetical protein